MTYLSKESNERLTAAGLLQATIKIGMMRSWLDGEGLNLGRGGKAVSLRGVTSPEGVLSDTSNTLLTFTSSSIEDESIITASVSHAGKPHFPLF